MIASYTKGIWEYLVCSILCLSEYGLIRFTVSVTRTALMCCIVGWLIDTGDNLGASGDPNVLDLSIHRLIQHWIQPYLPACVSGSSWFCLLSSFRATGPRLQISDDGHIPTFCDHDASTTTRGWIRNYVPHMYLIFSSSLGHVMWHMLTAHSSRPCPTKARSRSLIRYSQVWERDWEKNHHTARMCWM
jgi:hypothetical protein